MTEQEIKVIESQIRLLQSANLEETPPEIDALIKGVFTTLEAIISTHKKLEDDTKLKVAIKDIVIP